MGRVLPVRPTTAGRSPHWEASARPRALTQAAVDPLPQQVDVAEVACVLLAHPDEHLAQRHVAATAAVLVESIVGGDVERGRGGDVLLGERDLGTPGLPRLGHHGGVGYGAVEVAVAVVLRGEQPWCVLTCHQPPEGGPLDLGQVAHQPEQ
jgi:hypothetical protein